MINTRLIGMVSESKKYIAAGVAFQWVSLAANILLTGAVCRLLAALWAGTADPAGLLRLGALAAAALAVRFGCTLASAGMSWRSSRAVKAKLRRLIYEKLLRLGAAGRQQVRTSEAVQVAVEGVDQLEVYFGQYLPQFFYAMLAPLTLFAVLAPVDVTSAVVLLVCVPLIPVSIAAVQTWAKKLLGRYWGQYTALGDTFLENLQGLTTLKIYGADGQKHAEMNRQAEQFRRITMKVLTMQLNSITIMDLIAYGGAAAGMALAVSRFAAGRVDLAGALFIILLAAEFFLPMRLLGSFFHVAMNGMAAAERIFRLLDLPEAPAGKAGGGGHDPPLLPQEARRPKRPLPRVRGPSGLRLPAQRPLPLHGDQDLLLQLQGPLLPPRDAPENTGSDAVFRPADAAGPPGAGGAASHREPPGEKTTGECLMKLKKAMYLALGFLGLALGAVGAVLPLLPAFPFLLLAAFGFGKSSKKLNTWFKNTRLYRENLADYVAVKGMTRRTKIRIMVTVTLLMAVGFAMMHAVLVGRIILGAVWVFHILYFTFGVRTIPAE